MNMLKTTEVYTLSGRIVAMELCLNKAILKTPVQLEPLCGGFSKPCPASF